MRKITIYILSLLMVFAPAVSFASVSGGWTASRADAVMNGATATIKAFRGRGANAMKSVITHKPTAIAVGKEVIKVGGGIAAIYAITQIMGAGVDWVLDPANNRIKVSVLSDGSEVVTNKCYRPSGFGYYYDLPSGACDHFANKIRRPKGMVTSASTSVCYTSNFDGSNPTESNIQYTCDSPIPVGDGTTIEKYIPIPDLSNKILQNAAAGHADSQDFVKAVAVGAANAGELDAALDSAAETTTETQTQDPAKPVEPVQPFDPSSIIDAIKALGVSLTAMAASIGGLTDFFNSEPPPEPTPEDSVIPVDSAPPVSAPSSFDVNYLSFGGQCPVLPSFSISVGGAVAPMSFDMTPLCNLAVAIRPAIIAMAYFIGLGIVASAIRD